VNDTNGTVNLLQTSTLSYQAGKNAIINGGFDIWQRGTSANITSSYVYSADRWQTAASSAVGTLGTVTRQNVSDTTNLPTIQYCARVQRTAASTATQSPVINLSLESADSYRFAGQAVTVSFYARAGANYSSASSALAYYLFSGTGTNQNIGTTGFTGQVTTTSGTKTLTTTWQRFTFTGTVAATATQLAIWFQYTPVGTAGAADYFEITGVQLELGSTATTFSRAGGTIQGELAACQRYYIRTFPELTSSIYGMGLASSTTQTEIVVNLPTTMRINPSSFDSASIQVSDGVTGYSSGTFLLSTTRKSPNVGLIIYQHGSAALTQYRPYRLENASTTAGYLGFSAEL
jgi:hypothetical protein